MRGGEGFLADVWKKGVEEMMKKTEDQTKKKGMYLAATFGAVTLIALGALAVGMMNPGKGKIPESIDLNATPTPGLPKPTEVAKHNPEKSVTPMPTEIPGGRQEDNVPQTPVGEVKQTAEIPEISETAEGSAEPELQEIDAAVSNPDGVIKELNFSAETGMLWPVTGEALIAYSPDHAIYHKTLDSYRTSDYVLLGGETGAHVSAAADGIVTSVKEELKTGTTVTMRVSADHEIVYGLLSDVTVKEGDYVDAGTVFATVSQPSRYFAEDGSGVFLQVLEKDKAVNPMLYLQ